MFRALRKFQMTWWDASLNSSEITHILAIQATWSFFRVGHFLSCTSALYSANSLGENPRPPLL